LFKVLCLQLVHKHNHVLCMMNVCHVCVPFLPLVILLVQRPWMVYAFVQSCVVTYMSSCIMYVCMLSLTGTTGTVLKNANETRSTVAQNNQGTLLTSYNRPEQLGTCLPDKRPVRSNNSFAYAFIIRSLSMTKIS